MSKERELLERAYQYIPMSSVTSQEIRAYLAEQTQDEKPIAYWDTQEGKLIPAVPLSSERTCFEVPLVPLYLHPAPRPEFVRLSEEEVDEFVGGVDCDRNYELICAVENRLVEKNSINNSDPDSIDLQSRCRGDKP